MRFQTNLSLFFLTLLLNACALGPSSNRKAASVDNTPAPVIHFQDLSPLRLAPGSLPGFDRAQDFFLETSKPTLAELEALVDQLSVQAGFAGSDLTTEIFRRGGVDINYPYTPREFEAANPFLAVIGRYLRESGEKDPLFAQLNRELRAGGQLGPEVAKFHADLGAALSFIPSYEGISFRGVSLATKYDKIYVPGAIVKEAAYTSTSLQPTIAIKFAGDQKEGRIPTLFVIKGKSGKPVSYFSEYAQENEILFPAGRMFKVTAKLTGRSSRLSYVLMEEVEAQAK